MKKIQLVRILAKYFNSDEDSIRRSLKQYEGKIEEIYLHKWYHDLVGHEGTIGYLIKKDGKVYKLRYGLTSITDSGRVLSDEEGIPLLEALLRKDVEIGDVIIINEFCYREDRDHRDDLYYVKVDESIITKISEVKKKLEEEEL